MKEMNHDVGDEDVRNVIVRYRRLNYNVTLDEPVDTGYCKRCNGGIIRVLSVTR